MVYQYAVNISDIREIREVPDLLELVSSERKGKIARFRFEKDKIRCLFAEVLLRYALQNQYDISNPVIGRDQYGKPYLADHPELFFNLSHSGDWVVCGIGDQKLGIDVERMEQIDLSIADDQFSMEEATYLSSLPKEEKLSSFYTIWTLKESFTKLDGRGLGIPLNSFSFELIDGKVGLFLNGKREERFQFQTRDLDELHKMSICVDAGEKPSSIGDLSVLSVGELYQWKCRVFR
ncbi:MAG: 4'-phosphopantetheinyl transferase superfamily protein [Clostridiales bacterium]|nr:4'-phosphopantetheinyl transferase superfamily protein [Clostridiales bacterium]